MLLSALIFGLLGSFHCVGMCGPIAFLLPVDRNSKSKKLFQIFIYHFGRILAYAMIGLAFGLVGKSLSLFGMQQQLSILIGVLMIIAILMPSQKFSKYNFSKPVFRIIGKVKSSLGKELKKKTPDTFLTVGFLNGFLPCGLVYMAIFGSIASGSVLEGSLYMILFGIGTIPLMTTAIWLGNFLSGKARQHIRRAIPVFVVIMGLLFVVRGLGLGIPYLSPQQMTDKVDANFNCHNSSQNTMPKTAIFSTSH
ncbi:sulfite exporter TauE/SafE family protein [Salegentibacter sp. F188]|uniref:Sulfite exporter TauE/SafE family protein n=1 Tax=Autumnicola patrickiae TaxID=3075591 RepID=A0ABU3E3P6_9FLAO|nr:sulfite exporter TauE/SafE family protein [Salegentibacter sp. F188]MDT0690623.1 sulfite exporter TauE/SafE family protein [Salegentibacter sp. F188]